MEAKDSKKKKSGLWVTILVVLLLIATGLGGYLLGARKIANDVNKQKEEATKQLEVTNEVKTKLEKFIKVATKPNFTGGGTLDEFKAGLTDLTNEIKYKMTNNYVYDYGKVEEKVVIKTEEANKLTGLKPDATEPVDKVKVTEFNSAYKTLFNEEPSYEIDDLTGCPMPAAIDKDGGILYYFHRCGGASVATYDTPITSYDSDNNFYYVHQEVTIKNGETGETSTTKLLWKFDDKFNFVSTTIE